MRNVGGKTCTRIEDVGVAGLWRLLERIEELRRHPVVIAVAGMEGALFSVVGGLVGSVVVAVPTAVGYGVAAGGELALRAALASCAPGLMVVNVDNGYSAACAALRILRAARQVADCLGNQMKKRYPIDLTSVRLRERRNGYVIYFRLPKGSTS